MSISFLLEGVTLSFSYNFPAVKGIQAGKEYYIAMVPLGVIGRLFPDEEQYVLPEFRAQRRLNITRIPVISKYILDNRETYVFSALAATVGGEYCFREDKEGLGVLQISMDAAILITDGQHRKAAILEALKDDSSLKNETIPIVFFEDKGLQRSQQIFTDLNKNAVKTSNSISELYDTRDELAVITRETISKIDFINTYTDKEKDNLGKYDACLFTLNMFYTSNKMILGKQIEDKDGDFLYSFWSKVTINMSPWNELLNKEISKKTLREEYIATQSVIIQALGRVGRYYHLNPSANMQDELKGLTKINWKRSAQTWNTRVLKRGRVLVNRKAIVLTANVIKKSLGIPLDEDEMFIENEFTNNN